MTIILTPCIGGEMEVRMESWTRTTRWRASNARPDKEGRGATLSASQGENHPTTGDDPCAPFLCPPPAAQSVCPFLLVHQSLIWLRKGSGRY